MHLQTIPYAIFWRTFTSDILVMLLLVISAVDCEHGQRALVMGGTQFMGRWTVERLLSEGYAVTIINRGVTPYPWPEHQVARLRADREEDRDRFCSILRASGEWDVIVDFIGYHARIMEDTVQALRRGATYAVRHYIYISTDSVYWALKLPDDDARLNESAPIRFTSAEEKRSHKDYLKQTEQGQHGFEYGLNKLSCDRFLRRSFTTSGFPFTSLRLPDVYGPYDNQGGFWLLAEAVRKSQTIGAKLSFGRVRPRGSGVAITDNGKHRATWAYVADVVDAIMAVIAAGQHPQGPSPVGHIFNIAHTEAVSVEETCETILSVAQKSGRLRAKFGASELKVDYSEEAIFPTTDFGALDISKAKQWLQWQPRPMTDTVQIALEWYYGDRQGYPTDLLHPIRQNADL